MNKNIRDQIESLYNYRFESSSDLVSLLKPLTDRLLNELERADKEIAKYHKLHDDAYNEHRLLHETLQQQIDLVGELITKEAKIRTEHAAMKEALEWYADNTNYDPYRFMGENGRRARKALQCSECCGEGGITADTMGDVFSFECPVCNGSGKSLQFPTE